MITKSGYAKAKRYVESNEKLTDKEILFIKKKYPGPCLTISRQSGIEINALCERLIDSFGRYYKSEWAYFDKDLIRQVVIDHHLPERVQKFLIEEKQPILNQMLNELLGIHPPVMELIHRMSRTILNLAEMGNVILIGRGSNVIANKLPNAVHLRLISPLNRRIFDLQNRKNISRDWAQKILEKEDKNRKEFMKSVFKKNIDDPSNYHAVINISIFSEEELSGLIADIVKEKVPFREKSSLYSISPHMKMIN